MKQTFLVAGAAALALTVAPAAAKPGKGHGKHGNPHATGQYHAPGIGGCPPGLARKNNGCMAPGQAKKMFNVGQRYRTSYGNLWNYNQIPVDLRSQYGFDPASRYYHGDGYLYQVDPRTMLIQQVVSALLR
jgi:hypothetical protein